MEAGQKMSKKVFIPIISGLVALVFLLSPITPIAPVQNFTIPDSGTSVGQILHPSGNPFAHSFSDVKDIRTATVVVGAYNSDHRYDVDYRCDHTADDIQINTALVAGAGGKVTILEGDYSISSPILPDDNTEIEILGNLEIIDAVNSLLTADAAAAQPNIVVADASGFSVGQWVTIIDDNRAVHYAARYGDGGPITNIVGNTITLDWNLNFAYTVLANAFVSTSPNIILADTKTRIFIHGSGSLDGNKANQDAVRASVGYGTMPEFQNHCGIALVDCTDCTIKDIYVHDCNRHSFALHSCANIIIDNVEADACNDKNIVWIDVTDSKIINSYCHDSVNEDGIIIHDGGARCVIANNICGSNPRYGIAVILSDSFIVSGNYVYGGPGVGDDNYLVGSSTHVTLTDNIGYNSNNRGIQIDLSDYVSVIGNDMSTGATIVGVCALGIYGSTNVNVIGGNYQKTGAGREGIIVAVSGATISQDVLIEGVTIYDTANGIQVDATCADVVIKDNNLRGVATNPIVDNGVNTTVRNNHGWVTESSGTATLVNGNTTIVVAHGLDVTPVQGDIVVTPIEHWGNMTFFYIDTFGAANFTITSDQDPGQDVDFAWKAIVL